MEQLVKSVSGTSVSHIEVAVWVLDTNILIQRPAIMPGKIADDGPIFGICNPL